jgi:methionyl-tRNA formyltransferase
MRDAIAGGTVYWMDDGADTGAIAAQDFCHVLPDDTPESLWRRELAPMGLKLLGNVIGQVAQGVIITKSQCEQVATWEPAFTGLTLKAL